MVDSKLNIDPADSISEVVLEESQKQGVIVSLVINEICDGFYLTAKLNWSGEKIWTLTTRRDKNKPRIFKDLTRLNDYLKEKVRTDKVLISRK